MQPTVQRAGVGFDVTGIACDTLRVHNAALTGRASVERLDVSFEPGTTRSDPMLYLNVRGLLTQSVIDAESVSVRVMGQGAESVKHVLLHCVRIKKDGVLKGRWAARTIVSVNSMEHLPYAISSSSGRMRVYNTLFE